MMEMMLSSSFDIVNDKLELYSGDEVVGVPTPYC